MHRTSNLGRRVVCDARRLELARATQRPGAGRPRPYMQAGILYEPQAARAARAVDPVLPDWVPSV